MVKMRWLAALLTLCLLLAPIPTATMEDLTIDSNDGTAIAPVIDEEAENDALEIPSEIGAPEDDGQALESEGIDLSGLDLALEDSVEANEAFAPNTDVGETLVHIVKPADGETVGTGAVEIWLTWTFPGGDAKEIAAKLLPTTVQLIRDGTLIETQKINAPVNLVFTDEGAHYLNLTLPEPGAYTIRASVPGSGGYSKVSVNAVGSQTTTTPKPTATPKPSPEPIITVDSNGFGVDQTGVLRQYDGDEKDVVIPKTVNAIGEDVFKGKTVKSVTTHAGVKRILSFAFSECSPLKQVTLAEGLEFIGEGAFYASGLKKLTIPEGVATIEQAAFHQCKQLVSISIPASVSWMGTYMFGFSEKLKTVTFEKGSKLSAFGKDMFYSCTALENVNIPDSVKRLDQFAFSNCTALAHLTLPDGLVTISDYAFENCTSLKELIIPASVESMEFHTFEGCTNLTLSVVEGSYAEQYVKEMQTIPYRVVPKPAPKVSLSKCKATVKDQTYTGKALKPAITVKYGKKTLKKGSDYTVTYKNNKAVGTATATLTGKGNYTGTAKVTFKILPPKVELTGLKAGTKSFTATWKKGKAASGYQLQYALKKSFSGAKSVRVKGVKTTSKTVKSLKTGKTYYVRVRAYKAVGKQTYYSAWSGAKSVKVK